MGSVLTEEFGKLGSAQDVSASSEDDARPINAGRGSLDMHNTDASTSSASSTADLVAPSSAPASVAARTHAKRSQLSSSESILPPSGEPATKEAEISGPTRRTLQNRKAQKDFRVRRVSYLKDLEERVRRYEQGPGSLEDVHHTIAQLSQENHYLRNTVSRLQDELAMRSNVGMTSQTPTRELPPWPIDSYSASASRPTSANPSDPLHSNVFYSPYGVPAESSVGTSSPLPIGPVTVPLPRQHLPPAHLSMGISQVPSLGTLREAPTVEDSPIRIDTLDLPVPSADTPDSWAAFSNPYLPLDTPPLETGGVDGFSTHWPPSVGAQPSSRPGTSVMISMPESSLSAHVLPPSAPASPAVASPNYFSRALPPMPSPLVLQPDYNSSGSSSSTFPSSYASSTVTSPVRSEHGSLPWTGQQLQRSPQPMPQQQTYPSQIRFVVQTPQQASSQTPQQHQQAQHVQPLFNQGSIQPHFVPQSLQFKSSYPQTVRISQGFQQSSAMNMQQPED